ncbi:MAG: lipopolysaccharide core heptose(I) kinase RfaP [Candidatus Accumulibacter sp.]|jgi:heptose I phosphotransferase|nr:lipopolysaccharide core heptose(I) kinase RfaP [Accumulibacter sp.]
MSLPALILDEPFRSLWAGRDPFAAVEALSGEVFRELGARRTLRAEVAGRVYFVKIHRGVGWAEIVKNLLCLRPPVLGAENEWRAMARLGQLGVDTMRGVAFGQRGLDPATRHSFLITEELAPTISLEDFCRGWPDDPPAPAMKRALLGRVADMARRIHGGGVNHRDFYLCHFLLHLDPAPAPERLKLSLIDLHRAQLRRKTPRRWRDKDLAALYFSALDIGLTRRDVFRFLKGYFDRPLREILRDERALLEWLAGEAERLRERYLRKYFRGAA